MALTSSLLRLLSQLPASAASAAVLLLALAAGGYLLCRGRALLLPQRSVDRRALAIRRSELRHERWKSRRISAHRRGLPRPLSASELIQPPRDVPPTAAIGHRRRAASAVKEHLAG